MTTETSIPAVKPKRKPRKRAARTRKPAPPAATVDVAFPGLTESICATACSVSGCVISGAAYCAHPRKGGLRGPDMSNPAALRRLQSAQKQLAAVASDKRFS